MRAADRWDGCTGPELAAAWSVPAVHAFALTGSTNDSAKAAAELRAPHGSVFIAEAQSAGRGRSGKSWTSPEGQGIWMSVVLRPTTLPAPGLLPILIGLAAAEVLDGFAPPQCVRVKWPNDLYAHGRKLGGILCETVWSNAAPGAVVAGIGINVRPVAADGSESLHDTAISLADLGVEAPRRVVSGALARAIIAVGAHPPPLLGPDVLSRINARDFLAGRRVMVRNGRDASGVAAGIAPDGALLLRTDEGETIACRSGSIVLRYCDLPSLAASHDATRVEPENTSDSRAKSFQRILMHITPSNDSAA